MSTLLDNDYLTFFGTFFGTFFEFSLLLFLVLQFLFCVLLGFAPVLTVVVDVIAFRKSRACDE